MIEYKGMDFAKIRNYLFLGALLMVTVLFVYIIIPFAYPLLWAAVIATIAYPTYQRINSRLRHPNLSTTITLALVSVSIILPLTILAILVVRELMNIYDALLHQSGDLHRVIQYFSNLFGRDTGAPGFIAEKLSQASQGIVNFIFAIIKTITQNSLTFMIMFVLTLYTLFYFLRDGERLLKKLMYLIPIGDKYESALYNKFTATARATLKGMLLVGGLQGLLGGLLFAVTGVPEAILWGIIMFVFSVIPAAGSFVVWLPAGIIMLVLGNIWQGITILIAGTLIIGTVDNIIRPLIVGKDLEMHPVLILFSTLGGVALFGISGFILGPIIAALFLSFWQMYSEYYKTELSNN